MDGLITGLLVMVIDIYIILLFVRIFVTERERYDSILGLVFTATDPVVRQLRPLLPGRSVPITALVVLVGLLLLKMLLIHSILMVLRGVADTLLQLYVLIIIITATVREFYINPIANLAQRLVPCAHRGHAGGSPSDGGALHLGRTFGPRACCGAAGPAR